MMTKRERLKEEAIRVAKQELFNAQAFADGQEQVALMGVLNYLRDVTKPVETTWACNECGVVGDDEHINLDNLCEGCVEA